MRNGLFSSILNLVITVKSNRKYQALQANPEEAARSTYFGKKFIGCFIGAMIMSGIAIALSAVCMVLSGREVDLLSGFVFVIYIICFAGSVLFAFYAIIFLLSRLKYVKWQRKLNDLPIGKRARTISYIALVLVLALSALAIALCVLSLG